MSDATCSVPTTPACPNRVHQRGWCVKHYYRWYRTGDPLTGEYELPRSTPGVYSITGLANGWVYIGSTQSIRMRWKTHKSHLRNSRHGVPQLQADWDEYGPDAFICEVVSVVAEREERLDREQEHIDAHWGNGKFYNLSPSARDNTGHRFTPVQAKKVSDALAGRPKSAEHRANLWMNREVTPAMRERMAEMGKQGKGKPKSEGHRAKIGAAQQGDANHAATLTEVKVREIMLRVRAGEKGYLLAVEFGVTGSVVSQIKNGLTWKHITAVEADSPTTLF